MNPLHFPSASRRENQIISLFLPAIFFMAVAWMALLPAYEGMDEIGHYASIRYVAEGLGIPSSGSSFIPQETMDYGRTGPLPYALGDQGRAQFGGLSYAAFFAMPDAVKAYEERQRSFVPRAPYAPSAEDDWEAQHPPLYYLLMAPVMKATDFLPFVTQIFILRVVSFLSAMAGLIVSFRASFARAARPDRPWIIRSYLLYPLLVPVFVQEFARLGNDSLCLLWTGCLWAAFLQWREDETSTRKNLALGLIFALGLLTKALFLPLLAGFLSFLIFRAWRGRKEDGLTRKRIEMIKAFLLPVSFAGLWYVHIFRAFGAISGTLDEIYLAQHAGLVQGLLAHFTWASFGKGWMITLLTWFWAGTASQATFTLWGAAPFLLLSCLLIGVSVRKFYGGGLSETAGISLWLYGFLLIGLFYFELVCIALDTDRTPGWYLNIMLPFSATLYAPGLQSLWRHQATRALCKIILCYAVVFILCNVWGDMTLYTGCAASVHQQYVFSSFPLCLPDIGSVGQRLQILAWPKTALLSFSIGIICALSGVFLERFPIR
jgi:hypothetical protein